MATRVRLKQRTEIALSPYKVRKLKSKAAGQGRTFAERFKTSLGDPTSTSEVAYRQLITARTIQHTSHKTARRTGQAVLGKLLDHHQVWAKEERKIFQRLGQEYVNAQVVNDSKTAEFAYKALTEHAEHLIGMDGTALARSFRILVDPIVQQAQRKRVM